jgi:hypothetical protein
MSNNSDSSPKVYYANEKKDEIVGDIELVAKREM